MRERKGGERRAPHKTTTPHKTTPHKTTPHKTTPHPTKQHPTKQQKLCGPNGIRTRAPYENGALIRRLRPTRPSDLCDDTCRVCTVYNLFEHSPLPALGAVAGFYRYAALPIAIRLSKCEGAASASRGPLSLVPGRLLSPPHARRPSCPRLPRCPKRSAPPRRLRTR